MLLLAVREGSHATACCKGSLSRISRYSVRGLLKLLKEHGFVKILILVF